MTVDAETLESVSRTAREGAERAALDDVDPDAEAERTTSTGPPRA